MHAQRRRHRANPWRCLLPLRYAAYGVIINLALEGLESFTCSTTTKPVEGEELAACLAIVPGWLSYMTLAVVVGASIASVCQWLRSHSRGKYYRLGAE